MKLLIMQFPPSRVTSSLFGPSILLSTLFSNTLSLCSSLLFQSGSVPESRNRDAMCNTTKMVICLVRLGMTYFPLFVQRFTESR
jgi:hypothetical protein